MGLCLCSNWTRLGGLPERLCAVSWSPFDHTKGTTHSQTCDSKRCWPSFLRALYNNCNYNTWNLVIPNPFTQKEKENKPLQSISTQNRFILSNKECFSTHWEVDLKKWAENKAPILTANGQPFIHRDWLSINSVDHSMNTDVGCRRNVPPWGNIMMISFNALKLIRWSGG